MAPHHDDNAEPAMDCAHCGRSFHAFTRLDYSRAWIRSDFQAGL
jgi:hypothetical protein